MKERLASAGSIILMSVWYFLLLILGICLLPFAFITHVLRSLVITSKQLRAVSRLNPGQRRLLRQLWRTEKQCRQYHELYRRGYFEVSQRHQHTVEDADQLIRKCQQTGIEDWRIQAFQITSHDYWWWELLNADWWD